MIEERAVPENDLPVSTPEEDTYLPCKIPYRRSTACIRLHLCTRSPGPAWVGTSTQLQSGRTGMTGTQWEIGDSSEGEFVSATAKDVNIGHAP